MKGGSDALSIGPALDAGVGSWLTRSGASVACGDRLRPQRQPRRRLCAGPRRPTTPRPSAGRAGSTAAEAEAGRPADQDCGGGHSPMSALARDGGSARWRTPRTAASRESAAAWTSVGVEPGSAGVRAPADASTSKGRGSRSRRSSPACAPRRVRPQRQPGAQGPRRSAGPGVGPSSSAGRRHPASRPMSPSGPLRAR